jgi:hypothetical protein
MRLSNAAIVADATATPAKIHVPIGVPPAPVAILPPRLEPTYEADFVVSMPVRCHPSVTRKLSQVQPDSFLLLDLLCTLSWWTSTSAEQLLRMQKP